jgi:hypothetical protein
MERHAVRRIHRDGWGVGLTVVRGGKSLLFLKKKKQKDFSP